MYLEKNKFQNKILDSKAEDKRQHSHRKPTNASSAFKLNKHELRIFFGFSKI